MDIETSLSVVNKFISDLLPESLPNWIGEGIVSVAILLTFVFLGWVVYTIFEKVFLRLAKKTETKLDDEILKNIKKPIYFLVIVIGLYFFLWNFSDLQPYRGIIAVIISFIEILLVAFAITRVINVVFAWYQEKEAKKKKMSDHILIVLRNIVNAIVVLIAFFFILGAAGIDLSGVVVGFGVSGIVIGFALQNVLSDFFSAFSIYFDKPFEIGDFIIVGDYAGTVTKITMKSTRVKLLQGEELVLANKTLTTSDVRNFKKMKQRRISFSFGVTYNTPTEKLKKIPDMIKDIIDPKKIKNLHKLDRVHFSEFGDFSLNFDIVYYMKSQDYLQYMNTQQEINFKIREAFEKEGIEMAFPTQTIFLNKEN